jgi:dienelactone hydrolase
MFLKFLVALVLCLGPAAHATLVKKMVDYKDGSTKLQGYLVYDDAAAKGAKPGVLVIHNWMGLTDETKSKADALAALGYVAFAADIYGVGIHPKDTNEAGQLAGSYKADRAKLRKRAMAGLTALEKQKDVDSKKLAVIGYCFGGTTAIELGRAGAKVNSIASFHGGLDSPKPADGKNIKAHVLVLHGADDPYNKADEVKAFQEEMRSNKVDWQMVEYGGAVHSFTEKGAGNDNSKGAAYNEAADRRSWQAMKDFFAETL